MLLLTAVSHDLGQPVYDTDHLNLVNFVQFYPKFDSRIQMAKHIPVSQYCVFNTKGVYNKDIEKKTIFIRLLVRNVLAWKTDLWTNLSPTIPRVTSKSNPTNLPDKKIPMYAEL